MSTTPEILPIQEEKYEGLNIPGAIFAGAGTPVGSGLTKSGELQVRLIILKHLQDSRNSANDIKVRGVTAHSNMTVALVHGMGQVIEATMVEVREGRIAQTEGLRLLTQISLATGLASRQLLSPDLRKALTTEYDIALQGSTQRMQTIAAEVSDQNLPQDQAIERYTREMSRHIQEIYVNKTSTMMRHNLEEPDVLSRVNLKREAMGDIGKLASTGFDEFLRTLKKNNPELAVEITRRKGNAIIDAMNKSIAGDVAGDSIAGLYQPSIREGLEYDAEIAGGEEDVGILKEQIMASSAGMPRGMSQAFNHVINVAYDAIKGGPEAYGERISKMPDPVSHVLAQQSLLKELQKIDDPQDPLTTAVREYVSLIPNFDSYMSTMGFTDVYKAAKYAAKRPEEIVEWANITRSLSQSGDPRDREQLSNPEAMREHLRVAGSSGTEGTFRGQFLTKKIERLFGLGINRTPAWRMFSGSNSMDQLDAAISALEGAVTAQEVEAAVPTEPPIDPTRKGYASGAQAIESSSVPGGMEDVGGAPAEIESDEVTIEPETRLPQDVQAERFVSKIDEDEQRKALRVAKLYRERLDPSLKEPDIDESTKRPVLRGMVALPPVEPEPEPVPDVPTIAPLPPVKIDIGGAGGGILPHGVARQRFLDKKAKVVSEGLEKVTPPSTAAPTAAPTGGKDWSSVSDRVLKFSVYEGDPDAIAEANRRATGK